MSLLPPVVSGYPVVTPFIGGPSAAVFSPPGAQAVAKRVGAADTVVISQKIQAEQYKNQGNEFRRLGMAYYPQAAQSYEQAIRMHPRYTDAYYNYAQLMSLWHNLPMAIHLMTRLLQIDPDDHDARVQLGDYYERIGNTQEAKKRYIEVIHAKPDFDPAKRKLQYLLFVDQQRFFPETAQALLQAKYLEVIHKSRGLLRQFFSHYHPNPILRQAAQTIPIVFDHTQRVADSQNIAEYDAQKDIIRIDPQMMFSTPNVVGAYLAHELVHALDKDALSSIVEEQEGYRMLAEFWRIYKNAESDPNLDKALNLYMQGQDKLEQEVRRVYRIRTPDIPEESPGHRLASPNEAVRLSREYEDRIQDHVQRLALPPVLA